MTGDTPGDLLGFGDDFFCPTEDFFPGGSPRDKIPLWRAEPAGFGWFFGEF